MSIETFWFVLIAVLWTGYLILEGFDFGVGMLLPLLGRGADEAQSERRRRLLLTTIGPHWDGNEVWMITAVGGMFAAFPAWYAGVLSGYYLAFLLMLVALIVRNVGLEYRHKRTERAWVRRWDATIIAGSIVPPLVVGFTFASIIGGVPLNSSHNMVGSLLDLVSGWALLGAVTTVALSLLHGCVFVTLKTGGEVQQRARALVLPIGAVTAVLAALTTAHAADTGGRAIGWVVAAVSVCGVLAAIVLTRLGRSGWGFVASVLGVAGVPVGWFVALYPNLLPSALNSDWSLTVDNGSATFLTLQIMTWATVLIMPAVLVYMFWNYWVFRKRLTVEHLPDGHGPQEPAAAGTGAQH